MKYLKIFLFILSFLGVYNIYAEIKFGAFDPTHWNGVVVLNDTNAYAFRFVMNKGADKADGLYTFNIVERVGPFAPDGSYAEVSFNPSLPFTEAEKTPILEKNTPASKLVRLRYASFQSGIVGCVDIPENIKIETIFYNPWQPVATYRKVDKNIVAQIENQLFQFIPISEPLEQIESKDKTLSAAIKSDLRRFYFYAGFETPELTGAAIEQTLQTNLEICLDKSPQITGEWEEIIPSITNNLEWMKLYQPDKKRVYLPAGRRWIYPKSDGTSDLWTIFEWEAFFNAIGAGINDRELAKQQIEAVLDTQYLNGNIPHWRSASGGTPDRSQPPIGAFAVLKTYFVTQDLSLLSNAYLRLKIWHEFWQNPGMKGKPRRDANLDGLLEWGSDTDKLPKELPEWEKNADGRKRAAWESGQEDLPNFDGVPFDNENGTLMMNCIDLTALYALDSESMWQIASILGKKADADNFKKEYDAIKRSINLQMWLGDFYYDRAWDGKFSTHKAASNFFPMVAGLPDSQQAEKMIPHLKSDKEFWGEYVIPSISRDNPAFKDQNDWRGAIRPPVNYLVYQGLKRYKLDEIASEFAVKSAKMFLKNWQTYGLCRENFNSTTGEGVGQRYQGWGTLFSLMLLEDFIDLSPFDGLRIGNLSASQPNSIQNISLGNDTYSIDADIQSMDISRNRTKLFEFKGKAALRHFETTDKTMTFEANVTGPSIDFYPFLFFGKPFRVSSEGQKIENISGFIRIPHGITKVTIKI